MRKRIAAFLAGASAMIASVPASGDDATTMAAKFGALEAIQSLALSPDGQKVSMISPAPGGGRVLFIADLVAGGAPRPILRATVPNETLRSCRWASDSRLVCRVSIITRGTGTLLGYTRMIALNSNGSGFAMLTADTNARSLGVAQHGGSVIDWDLPEKPGHVLMTRVYVPEASIGTRLSSDREGLGVEDIDSESLNRRMVEPARKDAVQYISDGHGTVRIMATQASNADGLLRDRIDYLYRKPGSRAWDTFASSQMNSGGSFSGFAAVAVDSAKNVVYGFDDNAGHRALFSVSLDGQSTRQLVLARPDVDIDDLVQIGRDGRVVGASYATERRLVEFFDPELKRLSISLSRALPGQPIVDILDASSGESKLLLFASSDTDPGKFYVYDRATRRLEEVLPVRPELTGVAMGAMKPVTYPAADGTQIPAYLTLPPGSDGKNLPAIVMPHGGPGSRDEWGFDWLVQFFAVRGYAVLQPNFRGSTGYGSGWYQRNGFQSWRTAIGDVNDAGRWLSAQGIAAPGKLAIVGWSYGGYAALQTSVLDPSIFKAIVAVAPVTDLDRLKQEASGFTNAALVNRFVGSGPHIREGSPAQNASRITAPVLMFHGDLDQNVGIGQARLMAERLRDAGKSVQLVEFPGLDHQLADPAARTRLLSDSDAFLRRTLGL